MAPAISHIVAIQHACRIVNTPEPTLVPNELATSLAPMPKANIKAMAKPTTKTHIRSTIFTIWIEFKDG